MTDNDRTEQIKEKARQYIRAQRRSRDVRKLHLQKTTAQEFVDHVNDSIRPSATGKDLDATELDTFRSFVLNPDSETKNIQAEVARFSSADFGIAAAASSGPMPPRPPVPPPGGPPNGPPTIPPPDEEVIIQRVLADIDQLRGSLDELQAFLNGLNKGGG